MAKMTFRIVHTHTYNAHLVQKIIANLKSTVTNVNDTITRTYTRVMPIQHLTFVTDDTIQRCERTYPLDDHFAHYIAPSKAFMQRHAHGGRFLLKRRVLEPLDSAAVLLSRSFSIRPRLLYSRRL